MSGAWQLGNRTKRRLLMDELISTKKVVSSSRITRLTLVLLVERGLAASSADGVRLGVSLTERLSTL